VADRLQVPKGTFDVLGDDALARDALLATARQLFERAGYERFARRRSYRITLRR